MNIFLDTMIYLHFAPIEQLDLCSLLDADRITIIVPRITLKELDKHKSSHSSSKVRDRARRTLLQLETAINSNRPIDEKIDLRFIPHMPKVDMNSLGLNPEWNDDMLIASVVELQQLETQVETVLITDDSGARLTARHYNIRTITLPEKFRLLPELDDQESENRKLRSELQRIRSSLPRIAVGFSNNTEQVLRSKIEPPLPPNEIQIANTINTLKQKYPELSKEPAFTSLSTRLSESARKALLPDMFSQLIPDEEYARYNRDRLAYFTKFEQYLRQVMIAENVSRRTIEFTISISNTGNAPAEDVDIHLHFPDGFSLFPDDDNDESDTLFEPKPPLKPKTRLEMSVANFKVPEYDFQRLHMPKMNVQSDFRIQKTNSYDISDHFFRIKHGTVENLPLLYLTFDSFESAQSFHCSYEVSVANLPDKIQGQLNFVIEKNSN